MIFWAFILLFILLLYFLNRKKSVLVLLYHNIGPGYEVPLDIFEWQMDYLLKRGFHCVSLRDAISFMKGEKELPRKPFVLTFDDGNLTIYEQAYPIMKKMKLCGTLFVITSCIPDKPVEKSKYCSWHRLEEMEESGIFNIQPHSHSHARIYCNNRIKGYVIRNVRGKIRKSMDFQGTASPYFKTCSAFKGRRFLPDEKFVTHIKDFFSNFKNDFSEKEIGKRLFKEGGRYLKKGGKIGKFESSEEKIQRIEDEIVTSKRIIEDKMGGFRNIFCWPWGEYDKTSLEVLKKTDFVSALTTQRGPNCKDDNLFKIKRFKVWKASKCWFKQRIFLYSNPLFALLYKYISVVK